MPGKLVQLKEAAEMLGISTDELVEMRSRGEVHGYRDGSSWKFKMEEIERIAGELGVKLPGSGGDDGSDIGLIIGGSSVHLVEGGSSKLSGPDSDFGRTGGESGLTGGGASDLIVDEDESEAADIDGRVDDGDLDALLFEVDDEEADDEIESILVSEEPLGHSSESSSSTIIGEGRGEAAEEDSDIVFGADSDELQLGGDSGIEIESDVELVPDAEGSGVNLVAGGSDTLSAGSDVLLGEAGSGSSTGGSDKGSGSGTGKLVASDSDIAVDDDLELSLDGNLVLSEDASAAVEGSDLDLIDAGLSELEEGSGSMSGGSDVLSGDSGTGSSKGSSSDTGKLVAAGSGLALDDDLELSLDSELALGEDAAAADSRKSATRQGSDLDLGSGNLAAGSGVGSDIELATEGEQDDVDMMLAGSGTGSDISLGGDSGINLSPTDSGLSLEEEPVDLGGSSMDELGLPEDGEMSTIMPESGAFALDAEEDAAQMKADDEFLLTPVEEAEDESSGSQVIALEDSEVYGDEAQPMLGELPLQEMGAAPALVPEEGGLGFPGMQPLGRAGTAAQPVMGGHVLAHAVPETAYSIWNILSLVLVLVLLTMTGTFMWDLLRNIWEYEQPASVTASLMDTIIRAVNLQP